MAGETIKDFVILALYVKFLRCFMLLSLLFAPLGHSWILKFALLQFCISSFNQKCCLALLLLVNSKLLFYAGRVVFGHSETKSGLHIRNMGWPAVLEMEISIYFEYSEVVLLIQRSWAVQPQWEESWDTRNAASLLCH